MARKALGKGLDALIPEGSFESDLIELDIGLIRVNPEQPRIEMDEESLEDLARSVKANGLVQPVVVRRSGNSFELVAGERRWRAAQKAGLHKIPAIVRDVSDERLLELALVENIQRKNLNPLEEARAYKALTDKFNLTQTEIAGRVGKNRSSIANYMRLLNLSDLIQGMILKGELSMGHARALLSLENPEVQDRAAEEIVEKGMSVRWAENYIKRLKEGKKKKSPPPKDIHTRRAEESMQRSLGTKVNITRTNKGGKIEIKFYSEDDLDRLYNLFLSLQE